MSITPEVVRQVATLARLAITPAEESLYAGQLDRILGLMRQLDALPTAGVEPLSHVIDRAIPEREDVVTGENRREAMLANAPEAEEGHFRVPKIIE